MTWDSYRAEDGRWIVTAFHDGGSVGTWVYEVVGRSVHPADASARALMGGGPTKVASDPDVDSQAGHRGKESQEPVAPQDEEAAPSTESSPRPRLVSITSDPTADQSQVDAGVDDANLDSESTETTEASQTALIPEPAAPKRTKRAKSKKGRASVPSWDEILFGATKDSD